MRKLSLSNTYPRYSVFSIQFYSLFIAKSISLYSKNIFFSLLLFCISVYPFILQAQSTNIPDGNLEVKLQKAENYLNSFKSDSALLITATLLKQLEANAKSDTPFGIKVQLAEATALDQKQQEDLAITKLLRIVELSQQKKIMDVYAQAQLVLALIHEKFGRKENSLQCLQEAEISIKTYKLDKIYPYFCIRMASWQRIFNTNQQALYYATEALRTALATGKKLEEAISHMLMNLTLPQNAYEQRLYHCFKAIKLYHDLQDYTGASGMYYSVTSIYYGKKNFSRALAYNDSSVRNAEQAIRYGHTKNLDISTIYKLRGDIYKELGNQDSAWFYINKGQKLEIDFLKEDISNKTIEIDTRYANQQKQQKIEAQQAELNLRNKLLFGIIIIVLVLFFLIYSLYLNDKKQQAAKQQLVQQNTIIQHQAEQLRKLDAAKTLFFANISHELRLPLSLILGPINTLLKDDKLSEKQIKLMNLANSGGQELSSLINEILALNKMDAGKMTVVAKPTQVATFFNTYFIQLESIAQHKGINYSINIDIKPDLVALLDHEKCRQIVYNLLSNAFKFTPAGGSVKVRLKLETGILSLQVNDTGRGIHADDLSFVFDRYFQTNQLDAVAMGGLGIGLAICQEYTRLFGGNIAVTSRHGEGTTFDVRFPIEIVSEKTLVDTIPPITLKPTESLTPARVKTKPNSLKKPTIMVVEDNRQLQQYIQLILEEKYNIILAEHGQEALEKLDTNQCDLILSDLMMPVMDGYQLLDKLKSNEKTRSLPVIMLTARDEIDVKLKALRIGVDDYLTKPFEDEELKVRIDRLLKNLSIRKQTILEHPVELQNHSSVSQSDQIWLEKFEAHILQCYANENLNVPDIAHEFAMSESTLLRQLKRLTGLSPIQYIQEVRLNQARNMLENRQYSSVLQIAIKVGYKDTRTFSRSFKERFGKLPSELLLTT